MNIYILKIKMSTLPESSDLLLYIINYLDNLDILNFFSSILNHIFLGKISTFPIYGIEHILCMIHKLKDSVKTSYHKYKLIDIVKYYENKYNYFISNELLIDLCFSTYYLFYDGPEPCFIRRFRHGVSKKLDILFYLRNNIYRIVFVENKKKYKLDEISNIITEYCKSLKSFYKLRDDFLADNYIWRHHKLINTDKRLLGRCVCTLGPLGMIYCTLIRLSEYETYYTWPIFDNLIGLLPINFIDIITIIFKKLRKYSSVPCDLEYIAPICVLYIRFYFTYLRIKAIDYINYNDILICPKKYKDIIVSYIHEHICEIDTKYIYVPSSSIHYNVNNIDIHCNIYNYYFEKYLNFLF